MSSKTSILDSFQCELFSPRALTVRQQSYTPSFYKDVYNLEVDHQLQVFNPEQPALTQS